MTFALLSTALLLGGSGSAASVDSADFSILSNVTLFDLPIKAPPGWKSETQEGTRVLVPGDLAQGKVFAVILPKMEKKLGSVDALFAEAIKSLGEIGTFKPATEPLTGESAGKWAYKFQLGVVTTTGASVLAEAFGLKKGDDEGIILVLSDSEETFAKYNPALVEMIRSLGADSVTGGEAGSGKTDIQFSVPAGWERSDSNGLVTLDRWENKGGDIYEGEKLLRLVILPSIKLEGSLREAFAKQWAAIMPVTYETTVVPMPMMSRLKSGIAVAFDGDDAATNKTGQKLQALLYVLSDGERIVPILGAALGGFSPKVEPELKAFLESCKLPGSSTKKAELFSKADLVGEWSASSASFANYVTPSGAYAGDATVAYGDGVTLSADGSYSFAAAGVGGGVIVRERAQGTWKIEDYMLVVKYASGERKRRIFGSGFDPKVGHFLVLAQYEETDEAPEFAYPRRPLAGRWYKKATK